MDRLLIWLFRHLRPRSGWLLPFLAVLLALLLPAAIHAARWTPQRDPLGSLAFVALLAGWWLSQRRWRAASLLLTGGLLGLLAVANAVGALLPSFWRVLWDVARSLAWSWQRWQGAPLPDDLWWPLFTETAWRVQGFVVGLGAADASNTSFRLLLAAFVWAIHAWLGYWLLRPGGSRAWLALLPVGLALATNAFFAERQALFVGGYLALLLILLAVVHVRAQVEGWEQHGSDYATELAFDQGMAATLILFVALTLATVAPSLTLAPVQRAFWEVAARPWQAVAARVRATFPGIIRPAYSPLAGTVPASGLPRQDLLGTGPDLAENKLFRIAISNYQTENWTPYWKEATFARYTGRGWQLEPAARLATREMAGGQPWRALATQGETGQGAQIVVRQAVEWLQGEGQLVLAAGEPRQVSAAYRAIFRQADDLVGLELLTPQRRVAVLSVMPVYDIEKLRIVNSYRNNLDIYQQLPEVLPARVRDLARTVTAGATNPYDQASQIETYLRTLTYDLKVPLVAADRDLVDAFLFDLRRGYCDYFASAFVVMARSVGLPARLAVGYASGQTVAPGVWVVSAADAHSWPEVYFEGVGWVPFEPTPARPMPAPLRAPLSVASTPTQSISAQPFAAAWWIGSLALLLAGAFWLLLRANRPPLTVSEMNERMMQWGRHAGYRPAPGTTLREFEQGLSAHLRHRNRGRAGDALTDLSAVMHHVSQACEAGLYGGPEAALTAAQLRTLWQRWRRTRWLRWQMRRLPKFLP